MLPLLRAWLVGIPRYLWSGWGAVASLLLMVALWEALAAFYGPLVLPDPLATAHTLGQLGAHGGAHRPARDAPRDRGRPVGRESGDDPDPAGVGERARRGHPDPGRDVPVARPHLDVLHAGAARCKAVAHAICHVGEHDRQRFARRQAIGHYW